MRYKRDDLPPTRPRLDLQNPSQNIPTETLNTTAHKPSKQPEPLQYQHKNSRILRDHKIKMHFSINAVVLGLLGLAKYVSPLVALLRIQTDTEIGSLLHRRSPTHPHRFYLKQSTSHTQTSQTIRKSSRMTLNTSRTTHNSRPG